METGIEKAVRLAGSQTALAQKLGLSPQCVQKWVAKGCAPGDRCADIEDAMNGEVTCEELNPRVFRKPGKRGRRATDRMNA